MAQGWRVIWDWRVGLHPFTDSWHYLPPTTDKDVVRNAALLLGNLRHAASGLGVFWQGFTVSNYDVSPIRSFQYDSTGTFLAEKETINDTTITGLTSFIEDTSDTARSAIQLVADAGPPYPKRYAYYSGVPDVVVREGAPNAPANSAGRFRGPWYQGAGAMWKGKWEAWRDAITGLVPNAPGPWGYRVRTPESTDAAINIKSYVLDAPGPALLGVVIPMNALVPIAENDRWQIRRSKFGSGPLGSPNRHFEVSRVVDDSPVIGQRTVFLLNSTGYDLSNVIDRGQFRKVAYIAVGAITVDLGKQVTHARGKPKFLIRGRRSTRR